MFDYQSQPPLNPRKDLGRFSMFCFIYMWIMILVSVIYSLFLILLYSGDYLPSGNDGAPYLISVFISLILFSGFRQWKLFSIDVKRKNKKMTLKVFLMGLAFLMFSQLIFSVNNTLMKLLFQLFGSDLPSVSSTGSTTISMFLYASILGPISEELIFRGAGLRSLEKHGKLFAIVFTAILFGLFHGNFSQFYFAAFLGLVFGYISFEYSIVWSIVFHIINNLVIVEGLAFLSENYLEIAGLVYLLAILSGTTASILFLILKFPQIKQYIRENRSIAGTSAYALKSVWFWAFSIFTLLIACGAILVSILR